MGGRELNFKLQYSENNQHPNLKTSQVVTLVSLAGMGGAGMLVKLRHRK